MLKIMMAIRRSNRWAAALRATQNFAKPLPLVKPISIRRRPVPQKAKEEQVEQGAREGEESERIANSAMSMLCSHVSFQLPRILPIL